MSSLLDEKDWKILNEDDGLDLVDPWTSVEVVSRAQWGASPPVATHALRNPIPTVIFKYCTDTKHKKFGTCKTEEECSKVLKDMQQYYMTTKKKRDLPYNFIVCGDGKIYEGRGFYVKPFKNTAWPSIFGRSMEIAYLGDYHKMKPPKKMWQAAWHFVARAMINENIADDYEFIEDYDEKKLEEIQAKKPWYDLNTDRIYRTTDNEYTLDN